MKNHMKTFIKKLIPVPALSSVLSVMLTASAQAQFQWAERIASASALPSGEPDMGLCLDTNGNSYVTGWFDGTNDFGGLILTNQSVGGSDIFVAEYNSSGALQWARRAGGTSMSSGRGIGLDASGNVYVAGGFYGPADFGSFNLTATQSEEFFLAKYNSLGAVEWVQQSFGNVAGENGVYATGLAVDAAGNCYAIGVANNGTTITFGTTNLVNSNSGDYSAFLVKYDSTGAVQWAQLIGGAGNVFACKVAVDASGYVYASGCFNQSITIGTSNLVISPSGAIKGMFLAKFDNTGSLQWVQHPSGGDSDGDGGLVVDPDGDVYVPNFISTPINFGSGISLINNATYDAILAKYNSAGAIQWARMAGGVKPGFYNDYFDCALDGAGNVYAGGGLSSTTGGNNGSPVAVISKYSATGALQWSYSAAGLPATMFSSVVCRCAVDSSNNCLLAGLYRATNSFGTNVLKPQGAWNFFLAKLTPPGDTNKPALTITNVVSGMRINHANYLVKGTATDNAAVASVYCQLNGTGWDGATSFSGSSWSEDVTLNAGTNQFQAFAVDTSGNYSQTSSVSLFLVVTNQLQIQAAGLGTISPNYSNAWLEIGRSYSITSSPASGFMAANWVISTNGLGGVATNGRVVHFMMQSNLTLQVNFVYTNAPALTFLSPASGTHLSNGLVTVQAKATDNVGVENVEFYLNSQDFGSGIPGGSNFWTMNFALAPGTNTVQVVASDLAGNVCAPKTILLVYVDRETNANVITLAEQDQETDPPGPPGLYTGLVQDTGLLNAALKVPGLQSLSDDTWSNLLLTISFGHFSFAESLLDADVLTTNQAVFYLTDTFGDPAYVEQLTCSRSGNLLRIAARVSNPTYFTAEDPDSFYSFYINYWNFDGPPPAYGPIGDQQPFNLNLQDGDSQTTYANFSQPIYITGTQSITLAQVTGAADFSPPTNAIESPLFGQKWSNAVFAVVGAARDNEQVSNVWIQVNSTGWQLAGTSNNWTNWTAVAMLSPGINTVQAYALDNSGNCSLTNSVKIVYVASAVLNVAVVGEGTLTPNDNGELLPIGTSFTMKATATNGFAFYYWGGGVTMTSNPTLTFTMASNLTITANFVDVTKPTNGFTFPTPNEKWTNSVINVTGKAKDNVGVAEVWYEINHAGWTLAQTGNAFTNWSATNLPVMFGTNMIQTYAIDGAGNVSGTNEVKFGGAIAPASLAGFQAVFKPASGRQELIISWGDNTWAQLGNNNDTNENDYAAGGYSLLQTGISSLLLTNLDLRMMSALDTTNVTTMALRFTNASIASVAWTNGESTGSGTAIFSAINPLVPATIGGKVVSLVDHGNGPILTFNDDGTFVRTQNGKNDSGNYSFTQYSPTVGVIQQNFTDSNEGGALGFIELDFATTNSGSVFGVYYSNPVFGSDPDYIGAGTFTIK
jgi:hypothetical protein